MMPPPPGAGPRPLPDQMQQMTLNGPQVRAQLTAATTGHLRAGQSLREYRKIGL